MRSRKHASPMKSKSSISSLSKLRGTKKPVASFNTPHKTTRRLKRIIEKHSVGQLLLSGVSQVRSGIKGPIQNKKNDALSKELQKQLEFSIGRDFSNVGIQKKSRKALDQKSLAYTQGECTYFAPGQFDPYTANGENLIARKADRVLQQQTAGGAESEPSAAQVAEERLNENGITLNRPGCRDRTIPTCTSLEGIRESTIDGLIEFRNNVGVDLVVTGGTEVGHTAGAHSHANGYKVDLRLDNNVTSYIQNNFNHLGKRGDGAELYEDADGNRFAIEGNHWDVTFY